MGLFDSIGKLFPQKYTPVKSQDEKLYHSKKNHRNVVGLTSNDETKIRNVEWAPSGSPEMDALVTITALYGAYQIVKGTVKWSIKQVKWVKGKIVAKFRREDSEEKKEDVVVNLPLVSLPSELENAANKVCLSSDEYECELMKLLVHLSYAKQLRELMQRHIEEAVMSATKLQNAEIVERTDELDVETIEKIGKLTQRGAIGVLNNELIKLRNNGVTKEEICLIFPEMAATRCRVTRDMVNRYIDCFYAGNS